MKTWHCCFAILKVMEKCVRGVLTKLVGGECFRPNARAVSFGRQPKLGSCLNLEDRLAVPVRVSRIRLQ